MVKIPFKILESACIILAVLTSGMWSKAAADFPRTVYVKAFAVNIRTGPGLDFDKAGVVFLNTPLEAIDQDSAWFQVLIGDTMSGWVASRFTVENPVTGMERERIIYFEGSVNAKLAAIDRMTAERSGPQFDFLRSIVLQHNEYELSLEQDKIVLDEIFAGWAGNRVEEAVSILLYVMRNDLAGEIGKSREMMRELRVSAREALKILVR